MARLGPAAVPTIHATNNDCARQRSADSSPASASSGAWCRRSSRPLCTWCGGPTHGHPCGRRPRTPPRPRLPTSYRRPTSRQVGVPHAPLVEVIAVLPPRGGPHPALMSTICGSKSCDTAIAVSHARASSTSRIPMYVLGPSSGRASVAIAISCSAMAWYLLSSSSR